jgi:hypothetical protein
VDGKNYRRTFEDRVTFTQKKKKKEKKKEKRVHGL